MPPSSVCLVLVLSVSLGIITPPMLLRHSDPWTRYTSWRHTKLLQRQELLISRAMCISEMEKLSLQLPDLCLDATSLLLEARLSRITSTVQRLGQKISRLERLLVSSDLNWEPSQWTTRQRAARARNSGTM